MLERKKPPLKEGIAAARADVIERPTLDGDVLVTWPEDGGLVPCSSLFGAGLGMGIGGVDFEGADEEILIPAEDRSPDPTSSIFLICSSSCRRDTVHLKKRQLIAGAKATC